MFLQWLSSMYEDKCPDIAGVYTLLLIILLLDRKEQYCPVLSKLTLTHVLISFTSDPSNVWLCSIIFYYYNSYIYCTLAKRVNVLWGKQGWPCPWFTESTLKNLLVHPKAWGDLWKVWLWYVESDKALKVKNHLYSASGRHREWYFKKWFKSVLVPLM